MPIRRRDWPRMASDTAAVSDSDSDTPRVWVLLGYGAGGNAQMHALARAVGWPYVAKTIVYNALNRLPNPLLGASLMSVDKQGSDPIEPPWPDLVIAASRRSAPVARWIKRASGGRTRLVHLLHTQAPFEYFDLVVTLPQYQLPSAPNVVTNTLPLNHVDPEALAAAAQQWAPAFTELPRPQIGVLVGGDSSSYRFDADTAARLGQDINAQAQKEGGSVLITTSRRTPLKAARALWQEITVPAYCYNWQSNDADNPYLGILAHADKFVVTPDSASMPAEACQMGRPVRIFDRSLTGARHNSQVRTWLGRWLVANGWYKPKRDFDAFHAGLYARGLVNHDPMLAVPPDDLGRTAARARALVEGRQSGQHAVTSGQDK